MAEEPKQPKSRKSRGSWYKRGSRRNALPTTPTGPPIPINNDECPFKGWSLYFPNEEYSPELFTKIVAVKDYIGRNPTKFHLDIIIEKKSGFIDLKLVKADETFITKWRNSFSEDLFNEPERTISCFGLGLHQAIYEDMLEKLRKYEPSAEVEIPPEVKLRPINHEPITQFKELRVNFYGKLVSVRGTVIRCNGKKTQCTQLAWKCLSCSEIQEVYQPDGVLTEPYKCPTPHCRSKQFDVLISDPRTKAIDWQIIKIQEIRSGDEDGGRVPRTIEVDLLDDLVGACIPGDDVTITGVPKAQYSESGNRNNDSNLFQLQIKAVTLLNEKNYAAHGKHSISGIEFSLNDYYAVQKIHGEEGLLRLLVQSLCPKIFGKEIVKLGLLLSLFSSGVAGSVSNCRLNSHILIVGDPGMGKSLLLDACVNAAPRGVFVCGNASTTAGLSVSLVRDSSGDYAFEAGALVLADQGICCIDEFDKMTSQHQALLEAMEQQTISIAKGGVVCTLNTRCSIFAAANPQGGHYNKGKTVAENIRLSAALLSRFDLVFLLLDQSNSHLNQLLSAHIMAQHMSKRNDTSSKASSSTVASKYNPDLPLEERLQLGQGETLDIIPVCLLRKYIAYANKYVKCRLSDAATEILRTFYVELRKQRQTSTGIPVVPRQLQAMVRLTQARARLELRELATEQDALDVVEVLRHSLVDTFNDNFEKLDFSRTSNNTTSSRGQVKKFLNMLSRFSDANQQKMFEMKQLKQLAADIKISSEEVGNMVTKLNLEGFLIKKGPNLYQLVASD